MEEISGNFIHDIIDADLREYPELKIHTRFPPEPNGYLHIGSVKAICINTDVANKYAGLFNLRYDDTNPAKESDEFVRSIREDLEWLGATPTGGVFYGSDYFGKCYEFAVQLIKQGDAYVCDLSADEIRAYRGTLTEPGKNSPYRDRTPEENLDLFRRMRAGEFADGEKVLRAKIDMASPNINMRDPVIYRIMHIKYPAHSQKSHKKRNAMIKFAGLDNSITNRETFRLGMATALLSSFVFSMISFVNVAFISADLFTEQIDAMMQQMAPMMDSNSLSMVDSYLENLPTITFISNLVYCFIFGTILSAILSRNIPSVDPFADYKSQE